MRCRFIGSDLQFRLQSSVRCPDGMVLCGEQSASSVIASDPVIVFAVLSPSTAGVDRGHGLRTTIWLTPFDLGVRQRLDLRVAPGPFPDIYEVRVALTHLSGDDTSWYRMNRPFLTDLRRQFLQWRSLSPQRMAEYIEASRTLFDTDASASPGLSPIR